MTEKYKVIQEVINSLVKWRDRNNLTPMAGDDNTFVDPDDIDDITGEALVWMTSNTSSLEQNKRLIAIIQWLNGEDVFEVEKPHKFAVRSVKTDINGDYRWMYLVDNLGIDVPFYNYFMAGPARVFDTREEAELWTTKGYEVVEFDVYGNEVTN